MEIGHAATAIAAEVSKAIVGKEEAIRKAVATLLSGGHLLLEDIPGVGKTTLAKALSKAIGGEFRRVQFTPDLLPTDITGSSIYDAREGAARFLPGPVFGNVVLADEINRATPKTQSALLEAMEERQVTIDGETRPLPRPFFVIATQNQLDMTGTYPLPEAQLDRFFARISLGYPDRDSEIALLGAQQIRSPLDDVKTVVTTEQLATLQDAVRDVYVDESIRGYVVDVVRGTRESGVLRTGSSPRGSLHLVRGAQAIAAMSGRTFVTPDDVKEMAVPILAHRVLGRSELRGQGGTEGAVRALLGAVPAPVGVK